MLIKIQIYLSLETFLFLFNLLHEKLPEAAGKMAVGILYIKEAKSHYNSVPAPECSLDPKISPFISRPPQCMCVRDLFEVQR
jgi:hypothetical protein